VEARLIYRNSQYSVNFYYTSKKAWQEIRDLMVQLYKEACALPDFEY
jgi:hypothetical protein